MNPELALLSQQLGATLAARKLMLVTAESCTGGGIAETITETAGSSAWFDRGFISYSNQAKTDMLGVHTDTIACFGAVSPETAREMVVGALANSTADWALSVTGIAGPGGGSSGKPVGTVCFGWCRRGAEPSGETLYFQGDRSTVRQQSVRHALVGLLERLGVS